MPFRTGRSIVVCLICSLSVTLCLGGDAFSLSLTVRRPLAVSGPAILNIEALGEDSTVIVPGEVMIHLPPSVKNVLVEKYTYPTNMFENEIRAYTIQQAVFWTVATLALGGVVKNR